ncbi:hypothetical protein [Paenibacillus sp. MMO-177]|uniref:hypothetical protein n=1 Tax=Paenibacillus sp. MMO-177 TaxID=3081289 RepID=UPI0030183A38
MAITEIISNKEEYRRKVDKREIPTCNILGVNIAAINMQWLLNYLNQKVKNEAGNLLAG